MKISLIVPVYNEEKYIGQLLDSVLTQTKKVNEIIICDNGSTDNTVNIINKYQNKLPIRIVTEPIKGIIPAVEKAWRSSSGNLIIKTDADCILPNNWIKNCYSHFRKDKNLAACGGNFYSSDGNLLIKIGFYLCYPIVDICFLANRGYRIIFGGNLAIKKNILSQIDGYNSESIHLPDDQLISKKLFDRKLKFKRFRDCYNYSSSRRFNSLEAVLRLFLSIFKADFYDLKST